ncbi:MAG: YjjG family noncanonical pyrimidine nucleotidase [Cyclobacteriaceae bacterium]|nr:YjjG family noncanonical pyrimidine nucleotidase [Cyclobacteriaceae bacterium]
MNHYTCLFFDLDHTLWDYETNSLETLRELFVAHDLPGKGVADFTSFHLRFKEVNKQLWELYDHGKITSEIIRKERFKQILKPFYVTDDRLSDVLSYEYLHECPKKSNLIPHAIETLEYLVGKYKMTVITNGFEEIQNTKLSSGNLHHFFDHVITSQKAGCKKPAREIFEFALNANAIQSDQAAMIGDNLITDIGGARNASVDTVFYNPDALEHAEEVTHEINTLQQLREIL